MPRDRQQLLADNETADTLRSALDALDVLVPTSLKWALEILRNREELLQELRAIESQGRLF
jgi:hypothetical protein